MRVSIQITQRTRQKKTLWQVKVERLAHQRGNETHKQVTDTTVRVWSARRLLTDLHLFAIGGQCLLPLLLCFFSLLCFTWSSMSWVYSLPTDSRHHPRAHLARVRIESTSSWYSVVPITDFIILSLACFRMAVLISEDTGPFWIFKKLRQWLKKEARTGNKAVQKSKIHEGIECPRCSSVWSATLLCGIYVVERAYGVDQYHIAGLFIVMLAISGGAILWNRVPKC